MDLSHTTVQENNLDGELIRLAYVPVHLAVEKLIEKSELTYDFLNGQNPKLHHIGAIVQSIRDNGFKDPSQYDATIDAFVVGNGRLEALYMMEKDKEPAPRGIGIDLETGRWCFPVLFGVDAPSITAAIRYSIDHNLLTFVGGDVTPFELSLTMDRNGFIDVLMRLEEQDAMPITFSSDDLRMIVDDSDDDDEGHGDNGRKEELTIEISIGNTSLYNDIRNELKKFLKNNPGWKAYVI